MTARPILLDMFCCAGGAARGYHDAGFDVIGVDLMPQKRYPFTFIQGDALTVAAEVLATTDIAAIHASPPCQDHTRYTSRWGADRARAEVALTRDGMQVRPMTDVESNLMTQVLDLRRERAQLAAEVERLQPRTIMTVEELDALPVGSAVADMRAGLNPPPIAVLHNGGWFMDGLLTTPGLPARLLFHPGQEAK